MAENVDGPISGFRDEFEFLSNFAVSPIVYKDKLWPTVEHAYQAAKAISPTDQEFIRQLNTASKAKYWGKRVTIQTHWDERKVGVMTELIALKFSRETAWSSGLVYKLLATGDRELVEVNWWNNTFWGVCEGKGENNLGKILMARRAALLESGPTLRL